MNHVCGKMFAGQRLGHGAKADLEDDDDARLRLNVVTGQEPSVFHYLEDAAVFMASAKKEEGRRCVPLSPWLSACITPPPERAAMWRNQIILTKEMQLMRVEEVLDGTADRHATAVHEECFIKAVPFCTATTASSPLSTASIMPITDVYCCVSTNALPAAAVVQTATPPSPSECIMLAPKGLIGSGWTRAGVAAVCAWRRGGVTHIAAPTADVLSELREMMEAQGCDAEEEVHFTKGTSPHTFRPRTAGEDGYYSEATALPGARRELRFLFKQAAEQPPAALDQQYNGHCGAWKPFLIAMNADCVRKGDPSLPSYFSRAVVVGNDNQMRKLRIGIYKANANMTKCWPAEAEKCKDRVKLGNATMLAAVVDHTCKAFAQPIVRQNEGKRINVMGRTELAMGDALAVLNMFPYSLLKADPPPNGFLSNVHIWAPNGLAADGWSVEALVAVINWSDGFITIHGPDAAVLHEVATLPPAPDSAAAEARWVENRITWQRDPPEGAPPAKRARRGAGPPPPPVLASELAVTPPVLQHLTAVAKPTIDLPAAEKLKYMKAEADGGLMVAITALVQARRAAGEAPMEYESKGRVRRTETSIARCAELIAQILDLSEAKTYPIRSVEKLKTVLRRWKKEYKEHAGLIEGWGTFTGNTEVQTARHAINATSSNAASTAAPSTASVSERSAAADSDRDPC